VAVGYILSAETECDFPCRVFEDLTRIGSAIGFIRMKRDTF